VTGRSQNGTHVVDPGQRMQEPAGEAPRNTTTLLVGEGSRRQDEGGDIHRCQTEKPKAARHTRTSRCGHCQRPPQTMVEAAALRPGDPHVYLR
jgi:hypothetical protein